MKKTKAIRMPGKERPAASQSRIQRPPTTEPHHKNAGKNTKPPTAGTQANRRGSRSPILPEPAPCPRPWITPQGATPAERVSTYHAKTATEHRRLKPSLARTPRVKVKQ